MNTKTCAKCNTPKPLDEFSNRSKGKNNFRPSSDPKKPTCKACDAAYAREFRKKNPGYRGSGKNTKYPEQDRLLVSAIRARFNVCMANQRKRGKQTETDIDIDYLYELFRTQEGKCRYSGAAMAIATKHLLTLSLDKIVPSKGYVRGNVQWVCWAINRAKGELKESDFLDMCRLVSERATTIPQGSTLK